MTADTKYIGQLKSGSWRVRLPASILPERHLGVFETLEEAQTARDQYLEGIQDEPIIDGLTNEDDETLYSADELWQIAEQAQDRAERQATKRAYQRIVIPQPDRPFGLAYLSDLHIGDPATDYRALKRDAEIIRDTPRLWCGYHGDGINNWIVGKLAALQRDEILAFDAEVQLLAEWLRLVADHLLWVVCGNHDNWTYKVSGFDAIRSLLSGVRVLYDHDEVRFSLVWGERVIRYKVRHKWRYGSIFNATHPIEVGWQRGGVDFDVGLGGHTHIGTVCRPFWRHRLERQAVLTGTYKRIDVPGNYGRELGLPMPANRGCGAHVFWSDRMLFCNDLEVAARFLQFLESTL